MRVQIWGANMIDKRHNSPTHDAHDIPEAIDENGPAISNKTIDDQFRASNPSSSAWVSANAGSGKTYVLAQRVIRLLLSDVAPSKILCLTFTKAAAAEMSNRVFSQLSNWSGLDDAKLAAELRKSGEHQPDTKKLKTARLLFTRALESPGGLKIQTIHAFCEALLHQFTLEANTSGHFEVMSDYQQSALLKDARQTVLATCQDDLNLRNALAIAMNFASDNAIEKGLNAIINDRQKFADWINYYDLDLDQAIASLGEFIGVDADQSENEIATDFLSKLPISDAVLIEIAHVARNFPDMTECQRVANLIKKYEAAKAPAQRFSLRVNLYQTKSLTFRVKSPGIKLLYNEMPDIKEMLDDEFEVIKALHNHYLNWKMLNASRGLFKLADAMLQSYGDKKRASGILDFDDLVSRTANLLARSDVRQWVQFKLDQGIDHVLVDEAQDTSPLQWKIINAIIEEFFAGQSVSSSNRTVFAVGDQKQSIYSFQGAEPEMFSKQKRRLNKKADGANLAFEDIKLPISFRSTRDVLSAVDKIFADPANAKGLQRDDEVIIHEPVRQSDPGEVLIWPQIQQQKNIPQQDWLAPLDFVSEDHPTLQLARRIATTIKGWIDNGEMLPGKGRKIIYGDIFILVRTRDAFASAITRQLKQSGLKIAGADRLNLAAHIAVEDLLSLGKWALFPADDLALAEVLKSPLFLFDEEDLFSICINRGKNTLWQNLCSISDETNSALYHDTVLALAELKSLAATLPPFEFYSEILSTFSGRKKFKARLGSEVDDVLDAFLQEALTHSTKAEAKLQNFIHTLETAAPDIKREIDLQKDEIRVMTLHSAKGLEAPIVFLVDPGSAAFNSRHRPPLVTIQNESDPYPAFLWQPTKNDASQLTQKFNVQFQEKAEEEYRRLLYVGMTRAEDKLIICGYSNQNSATGPNWHQMAKDALIDECEEISTNDQITAWRWVKKHPRRKQKVLPEAEKSASHEPIKLPPWASKTNIKENFPPPPLYPSIAINNVAANPNQQENSAPVAIAYNDNFAIQRGNAIHYLLQYLPEISSQNSQTAILRRQYSANYLRMTFPHWRIDQQNKIIDEVIAILEDIRFEGLFSDNSRAEVSLTGILDPGGLNYTVNAQIDRIAIFSNKVMIVDYKSDRFVPPNPQDMAAQYLVQLAMYRQLVRQIFTDKQIICAIAWTRIPQLMEISDELLTQHFETWLHNAKETDR